MVVKELLMLCLIAALAALIALTREDPRLGGPGCQPARVRPSATDVARLRLQTPSGKRRSAGFHRP
jgi:hypothetical protein